MTNARIRESEASHWYTTDGQPCYEVPKKDGSGMTKTTLRHARELNLLPSVTTILKLLDKPALTSWKIEQAVLAVLTTPRLDGEQDDAFTRRVLSTDKEQDRERDTAAQFGTDIHDAIERLIAGEPFPEKFRPWIEPVMSALNNFGPVVFSEKILVGKGYAGRCDLLAGTTIIDWKTTKKLPKESYPEHRLQLAAYAKASGHKIDTTANIYISTTKPGVIAVLENPDIEETFEAFEHLLQVWQWSTGYKAVQ